MWPGRRGGQPRSRRAVQGAAAELQMSAERASHLTRRRVRPERAASSVAAAANTGNTGQYQHPAADTASASPSDPTHARRIAGLSDTSIMQRQTRHALNI